MTERVQIPGARSVRYRHESVPGPPVLGVDGVETTHGAHGRKSTTSLRDRGDVVGITVRGILTDLCIPRDTLRAFLDATEPDS